MELVPRGEDTVVPRVNHNFTTKSWTPAPNGDETLYSGAVAVGTKAIFVPQNANNVGIYDVTTGSMTTVQTSGMDANKFRGGAAVGTKVKL